MNKVAMTHELLSGEMCQGCDREVVLVVIEGDSDLCVVCDCGQVGGLAPEELLLLTPAA